MTRATSRWLVVGGIAVVVLAAAIALVLANRGGAEAAPGAAPASPPPSGRASPDAPAATSTMSAPRAPELAATGAATASSTASDPASNRPAERAAPSDFGAPTPTHVPPATNKPVFVTHAFVAALGRDVGPIAQECASPIATDARGAHPLIQVALTVSIKGGAMTIDGIDTTFRDVTGEQGAVKDCVRAKVSAIAADATGQPDVDHYPITMPMPLRASP